ncbi:response regulator [Rhizobium sp. Leaf383]|uniref:response regulator transcription factor n=1 Tax=Rhizobium sp. Leaf383 TaxID=1736357 RepID=UPI0007156ABA|nr:response regulator [Rhizobium sp. Leaf383]KQS76419.1 hypothetical protein ASG58_11390 [Rhizobium sp. Leaf383]
MPATRTVAIIDDDRHLRESIQDLLETAGLSSLLFPSADAFLHERGYEDVNCILSDVKMPGTSGIELIDILGEMGGCPPVLIMTSYADKQTKATALNKGAVAFLPKPLDSDEVLRCLETAVRGT